MVVGDCKKHELCWALIYELREWMNDGCPEPLIWVPDEYNDDGTPKCVMDDEGDW